MKKLSLSGKAIGVGVGFSVVGGVCGGYLVSSVFTAFYAYLWVKNGKVGPFDPKTIQTETYYLVLVGAGVIFDILAGLIVASVAKRQAILHGVVTGLGIFAVSLFFGLVLGVDAAFPAQFAWYIWAGRAFAFLGPVLGSLLIYRRYPD